MTWIQEIPDTLPPQTMDWITLLVIRVLTMVWCVVLIQLEIGYNKQLIWDGEPRPKRIAFLSVFPIIVATNLYTIFCGSDTVQAFMALLITRTIMAVTGLLALVSAGPAYCSMSRSPRGKRISAVVAMFGASGCCLFAAFSWSDATVAEYCLDICVATLLLLVFYLWMVTANWLYPVPTSRFQRAMSVRG